MPKYYYVTYSDGRNSKNDYWSVLLDGSPVEWIVNQKIAYKAEGKGRRINLIYVHEISEEDFHRYKALLTNQQ